MNTDKDALRSPKGPPDASVPEEDLHALVDGQLPDTEREALERRIKGDPDARRTVDQWCTQREALKSLHAGVLDDPIPVSMREALQRDTSTRQQRSAWWRWGGMAASVLVAFSAGWLAHGPMARGDGTAGLSAAPLAFAQQAAVAHAVYAVDQRHPVEVSATEQEHLVQWLSRRLGKPLSAPVLTGEGFQLLGGRLLPGSDGARAQFMYQSRDGTRLTLYMGALAAATVDMTQTKTAATPDDETAFRFTEEGPVPGFYWVDQGFGYALSGSLPRSQLASLAHAVHGQL